MLINTVNTCHSPPRDTTFQLSRSLQVTLFLAVYLCCRSQPVSCTEAHLQPFQKNPLVVLVTETPARIKSFYLRNRM
jgi:hypothetical protein